MQTILIVHKDNDRTKMVEYMNTVILLSDSLSRFAVKQIMSVDIDDGKKNISIDQVRELLSWVSIGMNKKTLNVFAIWQAELLSIPAQHALLKTLEEPPNNVLICLFVKNESSLLETVVSRCKKYYVPMTCVGGIESEIIVLLKSDIAQRIDWIVDNKSHFKDIVFVEKWFTNTERILRSVMMRSVNKKKFANKLTELLDIKKSIILNNANAGLGIENFLVNFNLSDK